jgi:ADP-heptose:LPS heptosyltransferase
LYGFFDKKKWVWKQFKCIPGEVFLTEDELDVKKQVGVVIEPRTKGKPNKQWPIDRYQEVADQLVAEGYTVSQLCAPNTAALLKGVQKIVTRSFRHALGALSKAQLYLGCEGGLHHGAAAVNVPAVVIFGGFIGPETTGYDNHHNIAVPPACGSQQRCAHCERVMASITTEEVLKAAKEQLTRNAQ